jgi:hypothetical protein
VSTPKETRLLGKSRRRCEDNIKMNLKETEGPVEGSCEYGNERSGSIKCLEIFE